MGKRLDKEDDEFLILIASPKIASARAPRLYRRRWEIETLFAAMKSRGFDLEATQMSIPEHIARLVGLLGLAFVWSHLVGQERHERAPLKTKKHGWREKSFFRYGLELLRSIMLNLNEKKEEFRRCIRVLTHSSEFFCRVVLKRPFTVFSNFTLQRRCVGLSILLGRCCSGRVASAPGAYSCPATGGLLGAGLGFRRRRGAPLGRGRAPLAALRLERALRADGALHGADRRASRSPQ
jgi:hypothetical protein